MERLIGLASLREVVLLVNPERCVQSRIPAKRQLSVLPANVHRASLQEKLLRLKTRNPYRKPTQVDRARSPRGTSDSSLRNSAKKRPYLRYKACVARSNIVRMRPNFTRINSLIIRFHLVYVRASNAAAKVSLATVYQKHSSLRTRKRMYRGGHLTNASSTTLAVVVLVLVI